MGVATISILSLGHSKLRLHGGGGGSSSGGVTTRSCWLRGQVLLLSSGPAILSCGRRKGCWRCIVVVKMCGGGSSGDGGFCC